MPKTGNIFMDIFSIVSIIFPLLPVAIIFIKKDYRNESLNLLMILCFLNSIKSFLLFAPQLNMQAQNVVANIFMFIEFVILIQIFKHALPKRSNNIVNIFLVAFLSVIITFYLLQGTAQKIFPFEWLQNTIIILIIIPCIVNIVASNNLNIFNDPLFWISTGSLFYFAISILMQFLSWYYGQSSKDNMTEKEILLGIGNIARYFFYTLAAFFYHHNANKKENSSSY